MTEVGPAESSPRVEVLLGTRVDPAEWRRRHSAGEVPDRLPYGVDRLEHHGVAVEVPTAGRASRVAFLGRGAVRQLGGGYDWSSSGSRRRTDAVLSWSEVVGVPVALRHGGRLPVVTGVIWATDAGVPRRVRPLVLAGLRRARGVVVLSSAQVAPLVGGLGLSPGAVHVVPFGVDADFFAPTGAPVDRDLVVSVGNDRHRDWPAVLAAHAALRRLRPRARLVVVSSTVSPALAALADRLGGVEIRPRLDHRALRSLVSSAAALLVLTGRNLHASGITAALEAQALGRPVVASDQPGMRDYAPPGGGMRLVPPGDAEAAARVLQELLEDPVQADLVGAAGRRAVETTFNTEQQAAALAAVLRRAAT